MSGGDTVVVDGANVAYAEPSARGAPKVSNIVAIIQELQREGDEPIVIVDASLRHVIDDPKQLEGLIDQNVVHQAPAGTDADYFILQFAADRDASVVTNDEYDRYRSQYPWIERRRITFMIINGEVELDRPSGADAAGR